MEEMNEWNKGASNWINRPFRRMNVVVLLLVVVEPVR